MRRFIPAAFVIVACAAEASAQTSYVGASLFGDIVRSSHTETSGYPDESAGGEAIGFALRVGTPLGAAWGVEAEFARPSEIERETGSNVIPLLEGTIRALEVPRGGSTLVYPPIALRIRERQRNTTFSAVAWAQQQLSARVSLVYLGGVGFSRSVREYEVTYSPLFDALPIIIPPVMSRSVIYGVRPLAGFESRLALTDRAQLVPGIRLHGSEDGWLVRPSVGIAWAF